MARTNRYQNTYKSSLIWYKNHTVTLPMDHTTCPPITGGQLTTNANHSILLWQQFGNMWRQLWTPRTDVVHKWRLHGGKDKCRKKGGEFAGTVRHWGMGRGKLPPNLGLAPMWHEVLFDEFKASHIRVAFYGLQNTPKCVSGWGWEGTSSPYLTLLSASILIPLVLTFGGGRGTACPRIFFSRSSPWQ